MKNIQFSLKAGACSGFIQAGALLAMTLSGLNGLGAELSTEEIFKKSQDTYAALTSYSDEGKTVANVNGATITHTFSIKLARPGFYRIDWEQSTESSGLKTSSQGAVWSAGEGDYLDMGIGQGARKLANQETALSSATGISGSAAATIPGTFFHLSWGNQLGGPAANAKRLADKKVGAVDCYVFTSDLKGRTKTWWIGKQDFLIHQVRTVTSAETMNAIMAENAKRHPEIAANLPKSGFQGLTSTETHENMVVNKGFAPGDFSREKVK